MLRLGAKRVRQRTNRCRTSARRCGPRSTGRGGALSPPVVLGLMDVLWGPTCVSARARIPRRGVFGRTHRSAPTRGGEVFRNQRELAWNRALAERRARQRSPPKGPATPDNPSVALRATAPFTQGSLGGRGFGPPGSSAPTGAVAWAVWGGAAAVLFAYESLFFGERKTNEGARLGLAPSGAYGDRLLLAGAKEAIEDIGGLRAGGVAAGAQGGGRGAVDDAGAHRPLHGGDGVLAELGGILKA